MSIDRRVSAESRRRRVIYQTNREFVAETAAERRASEKLREARRPTASYGSHVNRRLRGRWFSLVPVSPLAMTVCGVAVIGSAVLFAMVHWLSVSWAPLATNTELARPLRLDRPDSLGNWARSFFLAGSSATALLVYQLRRYKVDDYKGHYRLWRPVIILLAVMSVDSVVNLVPWCGAMIDAVLGKRMALAGADWIRIVLTVGGGALAIRLLAEVRSSRLSLVMMLGAVFGFAMPLASHWKVLDATAMTGWLIVTTAPLFAAAALWVSIGGYLRMLFREVRGLDQEAVVLESSTVEKSKSAKRKTSVAETSAPEAEVRGGWFRRLRGEGQSRGEKEGQGAKEKESVPARSTRQASKPVADKPVVDNASDEKASDADASPAVKKRSWGLPFFGRSAPKETARKESKQTESASKESAPKEPVQKEAVPKESAIKVSAKPVDGADKQNDAPKRRWFGLRAAATKKPEDVNPEDTSKKSADKKQVSGESPAKPVAPSVATAAEKKETSAKRSWFSLRRSGANSEATVKDGDVKLAKSQVAASGSKAETKKPEAKKDEPEKSERRGLGGWLRRDPAVKPGAESAPAAKDAGSAANARTQSGDTDDDDDEMDDGSVDWSAMNKSERRRMRKEIKRGGRAA
jgi:hypothetical protein